MALLRRLVVVLAVGEGVGRPLASVHVALRGLGVLGDGVWEVLIAGLVEKLLAKKLVSIFDSRKERVVGKAWLASGFTATRMEFGVTYTVDFFQGVVAGLGIELPHDENEAVGQAGEEEIRAPAEAVDEDRRHHDDEEIPHPVRRHADGGTARTGLER